MNPHDYVFLCQMLKERSGLALGADKQYLAESRLLPVIKRHGLPDIATLIARLRLPDAERLAVETVEAMMTHESYFFRDKTPFEQFAKLIVPALLSARAATRCIRIWCAASATGQEPYSLAMILKEMGSTLAGWRIEILATDISTETLARAQSGAYSHFEVQRGLPTMLLIKYFAKSGELWQLIPEIRSMVKFVQHNLLDNNYAKFGRFDLVLCRNVMIYMDHPTRTSILDRLADSCERDGYLVLGGAETVVGFTEKFAPSVEARGLFVPQRPQVPGVESPLVPAGHFGGREVLV